MITSGLVMQKGERKIGQPDLDMHLRRYRHHHDSDYDFTKLDLDAGMTWLARLTIGAISTGNCFIEIQHLTTSMF